MSDILVKAEGLSKKFCKNLKRSMLYGLHDMARGTLGRPPKTDQLRPSEFWALDDVSFELKRGECLGLIGPNGSGKSTLLKIINGILAPDKGRIEINGKIGALIEIGAGFHPMLTGRENIYANGAILGFTKKEIDRKFHKITEFAELEEFIDTPVKYYSSGMYVRLGFAIAVQMKPDVLIIDEVLAVGDAGFRSKCYNAISDIIKNAAVIFVSHAMQAITRICSKVAVIRNGHMQYNGDTIKAIKIYHGFFSKVTASVLGTGEARIVDLKIFNKENKETSIIDYNEPLIIKFNLNVSNKYKEFIISLSFANKEMNLVAQCHSKYNNINISNNGKTKNIKLSISNITLNPGEYYLNIIIYNEENNRQLCWHYAERIVTITGEFIGGAAVQFMGEWEISSDDKSMPILC